MPMMGLEWHDPQIGRLRCTRMQPKLPLTFVQIRPSLSRKLS